MGEMRRVKVAAAGDVAAGQGKQQPEEPGVEAARDQAVVMLRVTHLDPTMDNTVPSEYLAGRIAEGGGLGNVAVSARRHAAAQRGA